VEKWKSHPLSP